MTCRRDWRLTADEWAALPREDREDMLAHLWALRDPRTPAQRREDDRRARIAAAKRRGRGA